MNGSLLADLSAFDNFDAAVVRVTDDGRLDYLNRAARALLDCAVDEAIDLHMLFPEQQDYALARENLQQQEGHSISYRTVLRRPWLADSAGPIPVCIRAFPNVHMDGSPYGAIAWIDDMREKEARAAINAALATSMDKQQLLDAVAEQVRTLVPFDEFHITMIGRSRTRMRELYARNAKRKFRELVRWWPLPAFIRDKLPTEVPELRHVADMRADPQYAALARSDPDTAAFFALDVREFLSIPVRHENKVVAFLALYSYRDGRYTADDLAQLMNLPLAEAVMAALHRDHTQRQQAILDLLQRIGQSATDIHTVAGGMVDDLLQHFEWEEWQHASIFEYDEQANRLRMLCQANRDGPGLRKGFSMPAVAGGKRGAGLANGPIAEAALSRRLVNRPSDRRDSPRAKLAGFDPRGSQLAVPISGDGTRWVLYIESRVMNAFEDEEIEPLTTLADRAGDILAHSSLFEVQSAVLGSISDAVIETADNGRIRWCNAAAQKLFAINPGATDAGRIVDLAGDAAAKALLEQPRDFYHREVLLRRNGAAPLAVLLSASSPAHLGGRVYVASDFTYQKEVQRLDELKEVFSQAALEGRVPLALASAWLEQHASRNPGHAIDIDKILRQMARADLPLERLLRLSNQPSAAFDVPLTDICDALATTLAELPASLRERVDAPPCCEPMLVSGEFNDIQFCIESMISFGLRTAPESKKLRVAVRYDAPNAVVQIDGDWVPNSRAGVALAHAERWRRKTLYDLTLGDSVIDRIVKRGGGHYACALEEALYLQIAMPVHVVAETAGALP